MVDTIVEPVGVDTREPAEREKIEIYSPVDGELVGWLPVATGEEVDRAITDARRAWPGWASTPAARRGSALREIAAELRARAEEVAGTVEAETGTARADARGGILAGASTLEQYAELGPVHRGRSLLGQWDATDLMVPEPRGVAVALTPWNDPVAVACGLLGAAVVTGNVVLHKPSERAPHTGVRLGRIFAAHAPDGVVQTLIGNGRTGARLAASADVDVIAHVGSSRTGRAIAAAAARTGAKVLLENGGNDPLLVDGDVDPQWAAEQAATGAFTNCGQLCTAVERIYVHRRIAAEFLRCLVRQAGRQVPAPQRPDEVRLGPLVDRRHREHVHGQVVEAVASGAHVLTGGVAPGGPGAFYPATVLEDCEPTMRVMREETFGPVAPVRVVDDFEHGLSEAASGTYGLAATVLTGSMAHAQRAWRVLPVGTVKVNAVFGGAPGGAAEPRGRSGIGFGYGPELLDELTTTKVLHIEPPPGG